MPGLQDGISTTNFRLLRIKTSGGEQQNAPVSNQEDHLGAGARGILGPAGSSAGSSLILYAIGVVALGTPPGAADPGEQVVAWFRQHRDGGGWFVWAATVGILPFAVMF